MINIYLYQLRIQRRNDHKTVNSLRIHVGLTFPNYIQFRRHASYFTFEVFIHLNANLCLATVTHNIRVVKIICISYTSIQYLINLAKSKLH